MTLRSGKEVEGPNPKLIIPKEKNENQIEQEIEKEGKSSIDGKLEKPKKLDKEKEILEVFRKVEINIPLLDAIRQVPKYAKFLKDLCVNKRKLQGDEKIVVGENVLSLFQKKFPPKCGDLGMFTIPCKIGNTRLRNAMLDLGVSINVMPKTVYASLNLGPLKQTEIIIQLADRSNTYPDGLMEDVLVQVNELVFSTGFYVLDMDDENSMNPSPIILGRSFLSTIWTKIDVNEGTLTMEFDVKIVHSNIFKAMRYPTETDFVCSISVINPELQEVFQLNVEDELQVALTNSLKLNTNCGMELSANLKHMVEALQTLELHTKRYEFAPIFMHESHAKLLLFVMQAPKVEFKPLPNHLKYV
nr:uncharacterized protein LOC113710103 [Coffea arabica]